jgi:hypothetical protein
LRRGGGRKKQGSREDQQIEPGRHSAPIDQVNQGRGLASSPAEKTGAPGGQAT